jgi:hypothetical protein
LPNPDPSDLADWKPTRNDEPLEIDQDFEKSRADLRIQAQEWAGLTIDPLAELLVFVGRWSMQKGVDLIADVMPGLLEENEKVQLICIGPVIDLYGKFAALKLDVLMKRYPGRVFSKPEFTALPPYIFSGAEFALIPSRDEPFGLVAVEFGRKGALGIGARVGGLGQMVSSIFRKPCSSPLITNSLVGGSLSSPPLQLICSANSRKQSKGHSHLIGRQELRCEPEVQSNASQLHNGYQIWRSYRVRQSQFTTKKQNARSAREAEAVEVHLINPRHTLLGLQASAADSPAPLLDIG